MMEDIPTVQSMEAVDLHLRMIVKQLNEIREHQEDMLTKLATKAELADQVAALKTQINGNSPAMFWRRLTEIAVGVVAMCTAVGFVIAVMRFVIQLKQT